MTSKPCLQFNRCYILNSASVTKHKQVKTARISTRRKYSKPLGIKSFILKNGHLLRADSLRSMGFVAPVMPSRTFIQLKTVESGAADNRGLWRAVVHSGATLHGLRLYKFLDGMTDAKIPYFVNWSRSVHYKNKIAQNLSEANFY